MFQRRWPTVALALASAFLAASLGGQAGQANGGAAPDACGASTGVQGPAEKDPREILAALDRLYKVFAPMDGFVDVFFHSDGLFHATFVGAIPEEAYDVEAEEELVFDVLPHAPLPAGAGPTPDASDILCTGIRPGARMSSPLGVCTLGFIFTDGHDLYAATAGHCIRRGQTATVTGVGPIGRAVFSMDGGVGWDFALIRIDEDLAPLVRAEMCDVAGPSGVYDAPWVFNHAVVQTGHGLGYVGAPPRAKVGWGVAIGSRSFSYAGSALFGDSGSPARVDFGAALGTVTHLGVGNGNNFGTRLEVGMAASAIDNLTLLTVPYLHPA